MFDVESINKDMADADFADSADHHEQRRSEGLPTISALIGPVALGQRLWRRWARQRGRATAIAEGGALAEWHERWLATFLEGHDPFVVVARFIAPRLSKSPDETVAYLQDKTRHELELICARAHLEDYGMSPERLCRWLLMRRIDRRPITVAELTQMQSCWSKETSLSSATSFGQICDLVKDDAAPTLLVKLNDRCSNSAEKPSSFVELDLLQSLAKSLVDLAGACTRTVDCGGNREGCVGRPTWVKPTRVLPRRHPGKHDFG